MNMTCRLLLVLVISFCWLYQKRINSDLADNGYNPYSSFDIFVKELDENKKCVNSVSLDNYSYTSRWYRANEKAKYVQFVIDVTASKQSDYYNRTKFRYIFADLKLKDPKIHY